MAELCHLSSLQPPVKGSTYICTSQSKVNIVIFVDLRILCPFISLWITKAGEGETHSDYCEDDADGAENGLGWRDTRDLLREVHGLDGHVQ